ncbi:hypothetical protein KTS45_06680 [Halomicroarcula limicola]|uniref:Uncharacterized protein n=1 Tax=Haloarcula limicola TaxID=1429915 RepID=A0A8J7Y3U9_9EURY|nr:hypothetical protein [Halomicroarcula limicola]MBV0923885.1 hypothetical protein [Halomicroarcula limicola]
MWGNERALPALLLVALILVVTLFAPFSPLVERSPDERKTVKDVRFVQPADDGVRLWPYTSRGRTFERATLPINAVVMTDATTTYQLLSTTPGGGQRLYWNTTEKTWQPSRTAQANVTINETGVYWAESTGSERYTFTMSNRSSQWRDATYQLHHGTYFGSRHHLRLYAGGSRDRPWTAIQAHHEHWDWFRLRHDVNSLSRSQHYLERDFRGIGLVTELSRERWANGGAIDADGWVTVIELEDRVTRGPQYDADRSETPSADSRARSTRADSQTQSEHTHTAPRVAAYGLAFSLVGLAFAGYVESVVEEGREYAAESREYVRRLRESPLSLNHVALFASTALIPLLVRVGGIAAEQAFPFTSPKVVGAPFYALLAVGLPAVAVLFGRHLTATDGFTVAILGFGTGIMLDYSYLGLTVIPYGALVQRAVLLVGLGLLAAGGTRWATEPIPRHRYHTVGLALWVWALVWPLLG